MALLSAKCYSIYLKSVTVTKAEFLYKKDVKVSLSKFFITSGV